MESKQYDFNSEDARDIAAQATVEQRQLERDIAKANDEREIGNSVDRADTAIKIIDIGLVAVYGADILDKLFGEDDGEWPYPERGGY